MQMLTQAGLIGSADTAHDRLTEFLPEHSMEDVTEAQRHERFSFAVARSLDLPEQQLQEMLSTPCTATRLTALHDALADGRSYLAARSALKDMF